MLAEGSIEALLASGTGRDGAWKNLAGLELAGLELAGLELAGLEMVRRAPYVGPAAPGQTRTPVRAVHHA